MVESARMTSGRQWHPIRLHFLISSARHFAKSLQEEGFTVHYEKALTTIDGLKKIQKLYPESSVLCAEPSSFKQYEALKAFGVSFVPNDLFLTSRSDFAEWAGGQRATKAMLEMKKIDLAKMKKAYLGIHGD